MAVNQANATFKDKEKPAEVRRNNITAACAVSDAIRTSLGPKGMDKMIQTGSGEVILTNDGATMYVTPCRFLLERGSGLYRLGDQS